MFKPIVFSSLYVVAGLCVWGAYSAISKQDTSLDTLASLAMQANQQFTQSSPVDSKPVYRYKDENNNWTYSDKPFDNSASAKYEEELAFLKSLPKEAMPTRNIAVTQEVLEATNSNVKDESNIFSLIQEAKNLMKLLDGSTDLVGVRKHEVNEQKQ